MQQVAPHCIITRNNALSYNISKASRKKVDMSSQDGKERTSIKLGSRVSIVLKTDQKTGKLTEGIVKDILTKSADHPHGIKVRLETGQVGRVKKTI